MELSVIFLSPLSATFWISLTAFVLLLRYSSKKHAYWKERGVPFVKPLPLVGSVLGNVLEPHHELEEKRYRELGAIYGHYEGIQPVISVADPKLIRNILVKDSQFFVNRRKFETGNRTVDSMLVSLEGEDWKRVRTIISPTFTTGKLKRMLGIFKKCSETLVQNFKKAHVDELYVSVKKYYGAMMTDIIASAAFSTTIDSHNDVENKFVQMSKKILESSNWRLILLFMFPGLVKFFKIYPFEPSALKFFADVVAEIIGKRNELGETRSDFLQLLLDTAEDDTKKEKLEDAENENDLAGNYSQEMTGLKLHSKGVKKNLSMEELVAQCILFFLAGYEATATPLSLVTCLLALNEAEQEKARKEIRDCLNDTKGELTYDAIQKMKYLDNVISETLRLYPPGSRLERKAESDYKLGDTGITVPKGMMVTIPMYAIHRDPKYFPDPEKFKPDRFTPEEQSKWDPFVYLPFGAGPRHCVGMRFALLEMKVCLIYIINHFNIKTCTKTLIPVQFSPGLLFKPKDIILKIEPRQDSLCIK